MECEKRGYSAKSTQRLTIKDVKNQSDLNGFFAKSGIICSRFSWNALDSVWFENSSFEEFPDGLVRSHFLSITVSLVGLLRVKPGDFSSGQNLRKLVLSHNQLKTLEDQLFSNLTALVHMDLSYNQIDSLNLNPAAFEDCCKNFTVLRLQHNKLQKIDVEILKLLTVDFYDDRYFYSHVQYVDISYNEFTELEISRNVEDLNAANNQIKRLTVEAGSLIWSLDLSNNSFENLHDNDLFYLESLVELDLSNNYLGPLNISTFSKLSKLVALNLRGTNISAIQLEAFSFEFDISHQHALKVLNISDNFLGQLDLDWFSSLGKLEEFYVSGNKLRMVENLSKINEIFPVLRKISISNNDFDCSYLVEIINLMMMSGIEIVQNDAPLHYHESNVEGFRCVEKSPGEKEMEFSLAGNDTSIKEWKENINTSTNHTVNESTSNYVLQFSLGAAALMTIIYSTVKLIQVLKFNGYQKTRLIKLDSSITLQSDSF
jgi:Leucine-rich repeat (LRR) protein